MTCAIQGKILCQGGKQQIRKDHIHTFMASHDSLHKLCIDYCLVDTSNPAMLYENRNFNAKKTSQKMTKALQSFESWTKNFGLSSGCKYP